MIFNNLIIIFFTKLFFLEKISDEDFLNEILLYFPDIFCPRLNGTNNIARQLLFLYNGVCLFI